MKTNIFFSIILCGMLLTNGSALSQITNLGNGLFGGAYVGFNAGQDLDFRTNNINRMRLMQTGNVNVNQGAFANSGFLCLSTDPAYMTPWTLLHLNGDNAGSGPYSNGHRNWMRYGLLFTHNRDFMYVGPKSNGTDVTDAVIGWGDNALAGLGPDVLRFLFLSGTGSGSGSDSDSDGGLEIGRMTGEGHTGLGIAWTNTVMPKRTLDVVRTQNVPQFRITRSTSTTETGGVHTDFETSSLGHLHILPRSGSIKNVGIGFLSGTSTPTHRLDVMGNARFRVIPTDDSNVLITGHQEDAVGDYSLRYLAFNNDPTQFLAGDGTWQDAAQCDWNTVGTTQPIDLAMGYANACSEGHVGIGTEFPGAKLDVFHSADQENPKPIAGRFKLVEHSEENFFLTNAISATLERADEVGLMARGIESYSFGAERNWAGHFLAKGSSKTKDIVGVEGKGEHSTVSSVNYDVYGGRFQANANATIGLASSSTGTQSFGQGGLRATGLYAIGSGATGTVQSYGVLAVANGASTVNYGVYSTASGPGAWAGWFNGPTHCTAGIWTSSDENLKTNIAPIENASEILNSIEVYTYNYNQDSADGLNLPEGQHWGVMAQQLESVLPDLVKEVINPAQFDIEGNQVSSEYQFKAVNYTEMTPILIQSQKEVLSEQAEMKQTLQAFQDLLQAQQAQIQLLNEQLSACCEAGGASDKSMNQGKGSTSSPTEYSDFDLQIEKATLDQNVPNPFQNETSITYRIPAQAQVRVRILGQNGQHLDTLVDGLMPKGEYKIIWNASHLPAGMYYYTLEADGVELVKKAVKL